MKNTQLSDTDTEIISYAYWLLDTNTEIIDYNRHINNTTIGYAY